MARLLALALAAVALVLAWLVYRFLAVITLAALIAAVALAASALAWTGTRVCQVSRLGRAAWRNVPRTWWAARRWRWLSRNLRLAYADQHRRTLPKPIPAGTAVTITARPEVHRAKLRYPRATFRATEHGISARIRTVPGTGRAELEKAAPFIADQWRCVRCSVRQPAPGRLELHGLRTDPLLTRLPHAYRPPAVPPWHVYLGRDEYGTDRTVPLAGVTGWTIGGLPGYGKTCFVCSLLDQLAGTEAVQFVFIDGKGGGDYAAWADRAWIITGDELEDAAHALEDVHALMRARLADVGTGRLPRNSWHRGPTPAVPLIVTVIDECHTFFDLDAVKGQKEAEAQVRTCRSLGGQLVKKGRSVLFLTILITQKQTSDAIPTAIRDNCRIGLSFAVKTVDAAVAALGDDIRTYPSASPSTLQDPAYIGVCTAALRTGQDPFIRLRTPELSEEAAETRARELAHLRRDPAAVREQSQQPQELPQPGLHLVPGLPAAEAAT